MREAFDFRRKKSLVVEVREELERMILVGEVPAGERLNEVTLANKMGISRGPIREAARSLEKEGLVTTVSNKGVFVKKLNLEQAMEVYDLRAMIAGHLCARVAALADDEVAKDLRARVEQMAECLEGNNVHDYFDQNLEFHDKIAEAAQSPRSAAIYVGLCKEVRLLRLRVLSGAKALEASNEEHDRIVRAIETGNAETARIEASQHHLIGKQRLLDTF